MIEAMNLTKFYGQRCVVDHVNFAVKPGELLGFLGPNGAGKSTTMKMITGFLSPTSGTARIKGVDVFKEPKTARERLGYLPENGPLYEEMTVLEFLVFMSDIRNAALGKSDRMKAVERVVEMCQLSNVKHQTIDTLSKGFHQRVGLAQAIIHDPDYLILDEPTDGLDPNQKHEIRQLLKSMAAQKGIIMSTHILEEVEAICSRVIIIANGTVVVDEAPDQLRRRHPHFGGLCLSVEGTVSELMTKLRGDFPNHSIIEAGNGSLLLLSSNGDMLPSYGLIDPAKYPQIKEVQRAATPMDEVFRTLTAAHIERRRTA